MKTQRTNAIKTRKLSLLAVALVTLAMLLCSFTVMVSAAKADITIDLEDVKIDLDQDVSGKYTKVFDNTTGVTVTLTASKEAIGIAPEDDVTVKVNAAFNSANVTEATHITITFALEGADADRYQAPAGLTVGASITPKKLTWGSDGKAEATLTYVPGQSSYTASFALPALNGVVEGSELPFKTDAKHQITVQATKIGTYTELYNPNVGTNYQVAPLAVSVKIDPIVITEIKWANEYEFAYGDAAAKELVVEAVGSDGKTYQLVVTYPAAYGSAGWHEITVSSPDAGITLGTGLITSKQVNIKAASYAVSMNSASYVGNADTAQNPSIYQLTVLGDLPAAVREKIQYTVDGKAFTGTAAYGVYTVVAKLPADPNYVFVDADGKEVTELTATLTINRSAAAFGTPEAPYQVILTGKDGVAPNIQATVSIPEALNKKALGDLTTYKAYVVGITNAGEGSYQILIPISDTLVGPALSLLTAEDLYIYDAVSGTMVKATQAGYQVSVAEGYFAVSGLEGNMSLTFVLAPAAAAGATSFWFTVPGIIILILLVIILVLLILLIVREKNRKEEPVAEPVEEAPAEETDDEFLEEVAEEVAEELAEEVPAEEEAPAEAENLEETVEEAMEELNEEPAEEENTVAEEIVEQVAETLEEEVVAEETEAEASEEDLQNAVSSAMEENLTDESVEAFAEVDDDDDKDDDDSFGAFSGMDLNFIDVKEQPEEYAALLEQEKNGEVQLVTRYRRSYQSRLIQSQGNVQDYYNILKNALLSYKGVKSRISWNYEAFNKGRAHVAKMNAKTKTLYLYLALNPEELVDTKYGIVDVSSKKKYASVPVLMKIKGERKFKYALELIDKLCAEQMELPKKANAEEVDYHMPYQTLEEMVESGVVKMLVAGVPLTQPEEEVTEEAAVQESEDANVSFVAPADAPAVAAAAEEVAAEEAAVEASAEEAAPEETTEA